jgi:DNA-binding SARP family transcriptional activator
MFPVLHIRLLGDFSLDYDGAPISTINTPRLQSLLAYLVLRQEAPQRRHYVAYTLWPDSTDTQARSNLRTLLHRFRDALPLADRFLRADTHILQWVGDAPFTLDVADFEACANATGDPTAVCEVLERAANFRGGLVAWVL